MRKEAELKKEAELRKEAESKKRKQPNETTDERGQTLASDTHTTPIKEGTKQLPSPEKKAEKARLKRERIMRKMKEQQEKLAKLDAVMANTGGVMSTNDTSLGVKRKRDDEIPVNDNLNIKEDDAKSHLIISEPHGEITGNLGLDQGTEDVHHDLISAADNTSTVAVRPEPTSPTGSATKPMQMSGEDPTTSLVSKDGSGKPRSLSLSTLSSLSSSSLDSDDETSTSDSSSSSDNDEPDEQSTWYNGPASASAPPEQGKTVEICRRFASTGHCRFDKKSGGCYFRHELPAEGPAQVPQKPQKPMVTEDISDTIGVGGQQKIRKKERARMAKKKGLYQLVSLESFFLVPTHQLPSLKFTEH